MERVHRSGLDIDVALSSSARKQLAASAAVQSPQASVAAPVAQAETQVHHDAMRTDLRGRVKRWLRRPVAATFRLVKPFLRPIAFRTRRYLTEGLHQDTLRTLADTQREVQRASAEVLREVQSAREMLRQEVLAIQAQSTLEQGRLLTSMLQEQQTTRELVRRLSAEGQQTKVFTAELLQGQRAAAQAYDAAMAHLLQEQHATRDLVRQWIVEGQQALLHTAGATTVELLTPRLDRLEQYGYVSARRVMLHCAANEVLVKTEAGYVMCSDTDLVLLTCLVDSGELERGTRLLIQEVLQPGETFVDVGANVGMHTLAAGHTLQGRGRIIAFEPFEATRTLLEKTIWINGLSAITEIHGSAVSDHQGVQTLYLGATSGHHSLFELGNNTSTAARVDVTTVTLDSVLDPAPPVHLLKIDAEGAELDVLRGALATVRANPDIALIVEFGPSHLRRTAISSAAWLAAFTDLGLEYRAIDALSGEIMEVSVAQLEAAESTNLLFARPGAPAWSRTRKAA